ncbi:TetR family transcriptional regulator C-terminal domain-containing protein, partial [Mesorhizobium sp. M2C.T.Ca.TU.002.02.1.1]|uniref:TetR family transcriptional regulator C-terminal domain-containing protein n=1 Tax=Mesorhizobium sp. M2C.T.Ca.TU.002.02.1.1 TaxID=2496788 RepID=UPI000FD2A871
LAGLASPEQADEIVLGVTALIDGLWLRLGLQPGSVTREQAVREVKDFVAGRLALRQAAPVGLASAG